MQLRKHVKELETGMDGTGVGVIEDICVEEAERHR